MYICILYIYIYTYIHTYTYIYRERCVFIYILLTPSLFLVFFFQTASFLAEWNINPDAMATRGGLLPSPPKTTPSGQSPGSAKSQESKTPNSSERKIFLLQRKKGKLGAGLGRTTGWIHRATLNKGGVDMIGARLVYTLLSIYIYIYVYIARSLFLALARSRSLSLSLSLSIYISSVYLWLSLVILHVS